MGAQRAMVSNHYTYVSTCAHANLLNPPTTLKGGYLREDCNKSYELDLFTPYHLIDYTNV